MEALVEIEVGFVIVVVDTDDDREELDDVDDADEDDWPKPTTANERDDVGSKFIL